MSYRIPFNLPYLTGAEPELLEGVAIGRHLCGDGPFTRRCEAALADALGAARVLLTTSGTHALELSALLLELGPGDEAIVPSFTFVSTVNAFVLRGATPVFVDVRPDTLNMDEAAVTASITEHTRVIVPVHYAGVGCEMDAITATAAKVGAAVVEDNALGLFGRYRNRALGSIGLLGCQSFHETKSFSCGEGGAIVINDPTLVSRAEILREKGTDRAAFFRGQVDKYTWRDVGSSYLPSDILAAYLWAQLERREEILARRRVIWERYHDGLADWCRRHGVRRPHVPEHCKPAHSLYHLVLPEPAQRDALIEHLRERGILSVFHYLPLHLSTMGQQWGFKRGEFAVSEWVSDRLIRLPLYTDLTEADQSVVIDAITSA
jgi:dTDP-4-amino-4,6-dideoxygalactose transaminase